MIDFTNGTLAITSGYLAIGPTGPFGSTITLGNGQNLSVNSATISPGAILELQSGSSFSEGVMFNSGELVLNGLTATAGGGPLENFGLIHGQGRITAIVENDSGGEIRAEANQRVNLQGTNGLNQGLISLQGGTLEFSQPLTNDTTGRITGRGTLIIDGAGLTNQGNVQFSAGLTDVYGTVSNSAGATIITSGGGTTTFWNDVTNAGLIRTSTACTSAFFGTVTLSGTGSITGPGIVDLEGPHPGVTPTMVSVPSGNPVVSAPVLLSSDATIDTVNGSLMVSGAISGSHELLETGNGLLVLSGTNTYTGGTTVNSGTLIVANPSALPDGSSLTVGTGASSIFGSAAGAPVTSSVATAAVPEPGTLALLIAGAALLAMFRKRG